MNGPHKLYARAGVSVAWHLSGIDCACMLHSQQTQQPGGRAANLAPKRPDLHARICMHDRPPCCRKQSRTAMGLISTWGARTAP